MESTIRLPETRWGVDPKETKQEIAENRARAAVSIEYVCKTRTPKQEQPTLEQIAEDLRNLQISSPLMEDSSESIANPQYTEWIRRVIENKIERQRKQYDRAVKDEYLETGVNSRMLSLGVAPPLSAEERERIQDYEDTHISLRAVPDHLQAARMELYTSNVSQSQSSAASYDRSQAAIAARRNEAGSAASTEVAQRARRLVAHRENRKRRKDIERELDTARLLKSDGKETFSKFRSCCNTASKLKNEETGLVINYLGI